MKKRRLMFAFLLPATILAISHCVTAQDSTAVTYERSARADSLATVYDQQAIETAKDEQMRDSENLSDLKAEKRETRAKAREAQRVESEANNAAMESRIAYRKEKKAQKAREQADKQAKKAAKARDISDEN